MLIGDSSTLTIDTTRSMRRLRTIRGAKLANPTGSSPLLQNDQVTTSSGMLMGEITSG